MLRRVSPVSPEIGLASWWGFAEADRLILALVVAVLVALAMAYTGMRLSQSARQARRRHRRGERVRAPRRL
jgi:hypothetical protein